MSDCRNFRVVRARVVDCRGVAASRLDSLQDGGGVGIETMSRQMFMSIDIRDEAKNAGEEEETEAEEPRASFTKRLLTNFSREGSKEDLPKVMLSAFKRAPCTLDQLLNLCQHIMLFVTSPHCTPTPCSL